MMLREYKFINSIFKNFFHLNKICCTFFSSSCSEFLLLFSFRLNENLYFLFEKVKDNLLTFTFCALDNKKAPREVRLFFEFFLFYKIEKFPDNCSSVPRYIKKRIILRCFVYMKHHVLFLVLLNILSLSNFAQIYELFQNFFPSF